MNVFYSDIYTIPLPEGHRFPMEKYKLLRDTLTERNIFRPEEIREPVPVLREQLLLAHAERYVDAVVDGTVDPKLMRRIGFPWSGMLVKRSFATVGGALCSASEALRNAVSANLAGGTHHAMRETGEGFCVFNDLAVAALELLRTRIVKRVAIIDLDVHQGNGNSEILGGRDDIFIFSMHGARNFPFRKIPSTLDIELPDNTGDDVYNDILRTSLPLVFAFRPDIVLYQMGVDVLKEDSLGRLDLTKEGIARRDRAVLSECRTRGIPVSLALGGGYAKPISHTIDAQVQTFSIVRELFG